MTEGEKIVWAAAFAHSFSRYEDHKAASRAGDKAVVALRRAAHEQAANTLEGDGALRMRGSK